MSVMVTAPRRRRPGTRPVHHDVDLEEFGHELGVIAAWEAVA